MQRGQRRLLVATDNRRIRQLIRTMVLALNAPLEVEEADSVETAINCLHRTTLDFVVSDWDSRASGGADFVQAIRKDVRGSRPTIIVLASCSDAVTRFSARIAGADALLGKPLSLRKFAKLVLQVQEAPGPGAVIPLHAEKSTT